MKGGYRRKAISKSPNEDFQVTDPDMLARLRSAAKLPDSSINTNDPDAPTTVDWSGAIRGRFHKQTSPPAPKKLLR